MSLVSPAVEGHTPRGIPFGSTSGHIYQHLPALVRKTYLVPYPVFEIEDHEAEFYVLMRLGLAANVTFLCTANPSSIAKLCEFTQEHADDLIRDVRDGDAEARPRAVRARRARSSRSAAGPTRSARRRWRRCARGATGKLLPADFWPDLELIGCWKGGTVGAHVERFGEWFDPDGTAPQARARLGLPLLRGARQHPALRRRRGRRADGRHERLRVRRGRRGRRRSRRPRALDVPRRARGRLAARLLRLPDDDRRPLPLRHQRHRARRGLPQRGPGHHVPAQGPRDDEPHRREGQRQPGDRGGHRGRRGGRRRRSRTSARWPTSMPRATSSRSSPKGELSEAQGRSLLEAIEQQARGPQHRVRRASARASGSRRPSCR